MTAACVAYVGSAAWRDLPAALAAAATVVTGMPAAWRLLAPGPERSG